MKIKVIGARFGRWTVLARVMPDKWNRQRYKCKCECGRVRVVRWQTLQRSKGCRGCQPRILPDRTTHGERAKNTRIYRAWQAMKRRCHPNVDPSDRNYYALGIHVEYKPWRTSYIKFRDYVLEHLGDCPPGSTLDRIDNDRGYFPGNIRWATRSQQRRNQRRKPSGGNK